MIQRSIDASGTSAASNAGNRPAVIVRGGADCAVEGFEGHRVVAETESRFGGLDVRERGGAIEVNVGRSCVVRVPASSAVKIYSGRGASVTGVRGPVVINAGGSVRVAQVALLEACNAGGGIDVDCERLTTADAKFHAGKDIRVRVRTLTDALVKVNDAGGYWEGVTGDGRATLHLKCGGAATLVTEQEVSGKVLGNIERPNV